MNGGCVILEQGELRFERRHVVAGRRRRRSEEAFRHKCLELLQLKQLVLLGVSELRFALLIHHFVAGTRELHQTERVVLAMVTGSVEGNLLV